MSNIKLNFFKDILIVCSDSLILHERKIRESLEINNLETKAECDKSIKVLNRDRGNIVNTNSWKPLFRKINMVRHDNAMK